MYACVYIAVEKKSREFVDAFVVFVVVLKHSNIKKKTVFCIIKIKNISTAAKNRAYNVNGAFIEFETNY